MKALIKRLFAKRMDEAELNKESLKAGAHFLKNQGKGVPLKTRQDMVNFVATGFFMGYRHKENELQLKGKEKWKDNINPNL